jgi:hypothetical protein
MPTSPSLLSAISSYVDQTGRRLAGIQSFARWKARDPALASFASVPELVRACRDGTSEVQDKLLGALVGISLEEPLAALAVVPALSRRLAGVACAWRRGGASTSDLVVLEADLVSECWAALKTLAAGVAAGEAVPPKVAFAIMDQARCVVRSQRLRELRSARRQVCLEGHIPFLAREDEALATEELAKQIGAAVRAGRLSVAAARPVFLTRVAGYSTEAAGERLGQSPAVVRALRSRAERALVRCWAH